MRKVVTILIIFSIFLAISSVFLYINKFSISEDEAIALGDDKVSEVNVKEYPFKVGEKLHYGIYSAGLKVGSATITYLGPKEINGKVTSFISLEARAPGFYDFEKIYGDIETSLPVRIERKVRLFGKDSEIIEDYNHEKMEVVIRRNSRDPKQEVIRSEDKINNIILLLYQFRYKKDYKIGDTLQFNLPTKQLEMLVDKERTIKVPDGTYESIYIRSIPPRFKVWFRNNEDRIPLRIQGAIGFGRTYLALLRVEQP